nr:transcription factor jun-B isoform X2 [Crassostrea gigas]
MLNRGLLSHPTDTFNEKMEDADTDLQISSSQDSLMEAALAALGTGDMTPLVKEELKLTIQSRRLASGKGELRVNFEPPTQSELTEEERVKVDRRREQNRMAAQRFRQKQKTLGDRVQRVRGLESDNTRLRAELRILREERDDLRRRLTEHLKVCPGVSLYVVNT